MNRGEATDSRSRCQDCGNQAKKDCEHSRCRSCCKNRGFQCETHIKSTWIPVARRRPRHLAMHPQHQIQPLHHQQLVLGPNPKRYREIPPLGFEEENLPAEACFPAVFRCVRVSSIDNAVDDQYAYQTSVSIGGHVFTGILYDQGAEPQGTGNYVTGESSSSAAAGLSEQPNFVARTTGTTSPSFAAPFSAFTNATSHFLHYPKS
ncbi:protein SHI RELATED SEQUENCE 1-like [Salvia miltiorrhiza]|uniref:protein SHI RELATED SEQUENCE 1-like n=1 Tax=Salvia miltiorrhiza TaxID=226208 RepID=UPI0025ABAE01|nr:protein SHI RELATED SEQUENCE 1-like [Salvia miltiorrhiza]